MSGGFEFGDTSQYPGATVVERSIALGYPVIYVSSNYRLNGDYVYIVVFTLGLIFIFVAFGFLSSKEVKDAGIGNLGLLDRKPIAFYVF